MSIREELRSLLAEKTIADLVEVLDPEEYGEAHIKGAINIPLTEIGKESTERFDPNQEIVVYCANSSCTASPTAAEKLDKLGFKKVYDYEGGKEDWMEAGNPIDYREDSE